MSPHERVRLLVLTVMPSPYQRELFHAMAAHPGLDLRVCYYTPSAPDRQWDRPELPAYSRVLPGFALHAITRCCCFNPSVLSVLRTEPFDLVVVGDYFTLTAQMAMRYLSWRGIPWVLWGESPGIQSRGPVGRRLRQLAQAPIRRHAAAVAAIGTRAVQVYRDVLGPHVPVFNIPYHCDLSAYLAIRRPFDRAGESDTSGAAVPSARRGVRFLFSGQMIPRKGVDVLIRSFERMCRRDSRATLTLLGDGPYREHYRRMVSREWRDRVCFAGFRQPRDLPQAFADADVFVLPSRYDGWGVVVNEALAAGMPIISTSSVGAAADLIEPAGNGFVVAPDDVGGLSAAMERFVAEPHLVGCFGARSRAMASDWTVDRGAERWYGLCRAVATMKNEGARFLPDSCHSSFASVG